ncbi:MAG: hypothetical protein AM326_12500 [Candidatus Thorarchaeota archaeon SMTZ-45]|nr:MAG: hypothetical protein AM325_06975 [Candidatus Thorarchaeota archaeon SMTZ1-45]KXH77290.1 MAG: hypothetical protein AM326_12500 [Candidatus Thorarchaeota archaeon SMTZ-45]
MPIFPPGDLFRDLSLVLDSAAAFYSILIGAVLLRQWYDRQYRRIVDIRLAWSTFFIGMVVNRGAFIFADFYLTTEPFNTIFVKFGYIGLILALSAFFFALEAILPNNTRQIFFIAGLLHILLTIVFPRALLEMVAASIAIVTFVGVMLFLNYTMRNTIGELKSSIQKIVAAFLAGFLGFILASDPVYYNLGLWPYLVGETLLVIGITGFGIGIIYTPTLDELDWKQQLVELFIIQEGGLLVYHHEFVENAEIDQVLTAAGISGVQSLFQEITRSETGLNIVTVGEFAILFSHSLTFTTVLISREPYNVLLAKLKELTSSFENMFGMIIQNFEGSLKEFSSAQDLVNSIFQ